MKNEEFKTKKFANATVYTLESATSGGTSAGGIASVSAPIGGVRRRGDNLIAQEGDKDKVDAIKPRNFVAKNAKMGGAGQHKDKKKAEKQGDFKHKNKSLDMAESERTMSRAAKGYEKYGKKGMQALAKAGRDGAGEEKLDKIRDKHDKYNEGVAGPEKCWPGHRKVGTKPGTGKNAGKRVNDCEKIGEQDMSEDHEIQMASSELESIAKDAVHLLDLVRKYSEQEGLQAWQQSKITKAADYLNSVLQSISGEQSNVNETLDTSDLIDAVYDALTQNYGDVVRQYGHETVGDAIINVVKSYGNSAEGFDEIDMMANDVMDTLKGGNDDMEEDHSTMGQGYGIGGYNTAQSQAIRPGAGQNMPVAEDAYIAELFNKLAEKIPANAPVDVWIKDFEKSNAPQFRGKNLEKRRQMAVAASYSAKNPSKKKKK